MACIVTSGRKVACNDTHGGVKAIYLVNYLENAFTVTSGLVTALNVGLTEAFKYETRLDASTLSEDMVTDRQTGTRVNTQTLVVGLTKRDPQTALQIELASAGRPHVVVEDYNDNFYVVGLSNGLDVTTAVATTGGARADFNGFTVTFTGTEKTYAPKLDDSTKAAFLSIVSATVIDPDV